MAYHARLSLMPGGFVGVDVFLVISGFLFTGILFDQIDHGRFSMLTFCARRLRRLMPAAVVMVAATLAAGFFILGPLELRRLAGSAIAVLALVPNFFFWRRQGYFEDQVPEQALLHTWSLGLEEQFYLLFPLVLLSIAALSARLRRFAFATAALVLFAFNVWLTGAHPGSAFYLLPARAWEFVVGGLAALSASVAAPRALRWLISALGIAGIVLAGVMLRPTTPYPGVAALVPVLSTGALIWANSADLAGIGKLLAARWLTTVGALSYSLYLWHWPVLTLARDYTGRELDATETLGALGAVALLSYLSWKWVERPYRLGGDPEAARRPLTAFIVVGVAILATAAVTVARNGFPERLSTTALAFDTAGEAEAADAGRCHRAPPDPGILCSLVISTGTRAHLLVWGDSHASALAPALTELGKRYTVAVTQASYSSCPPLLDVHVAHMPRGQYCRDFNASTLRAVPELGVTRVLLAAYWSAYLPLRPEPAVDRLVDPYRDSDDLGGGSAADNVRNFSAAVQRTVQALEHLGVEVWILRQVPDQHEFVPLALSRAAARGINYADMGTTLAQYRHNQAQIDTIFKTLGNAAHLLDPATPLCGDGLCRSSVAGQSLYIDANHLSASGALRVAPALEPLFH